MDIERKDLRIINNGGKLYSNLSHINDDFLNIQNIYENNLKIWHIDNSDIITLKSGNTIYIINGIIEDTDNISTSKSKKGSPLSEVEFIEFEIENLLKIDTDKFNESFHKKLEHYSIYLNKKRINVEWTLNDYFNHYLKTKRFGFNIVRTFDNGHYSIFKDEIKKYLFRYNYFFEKLSDDDKSELKNDFCDQLSQLKNKQTISKFKEVIEDVLTEINSKYKDYKIRRSPQSQDDRHLTENWFKVGLLFANGEMGMLITEHSKNATKIAKHIDPIKWAGYRPYISESISVKPSQKDKCIFENKVKMKKIIDYCKNKNIPIVESFMDRYAIE